VSTDPSEKAVRLRWDQVAERDLTPANQFLIQSDGHDFYLTVGYAAPPAVIGTPEEQAAELGRLDAIQVSIVARLVVSRSRLRQLRELLNQAPLDDAGTGVQP
jgi:hypothetical protein